MSETDHTETHVSEHRAARPLKYVKDKGGKGWLCDADVDTNGDLKAQGCWRCEDMAFPNGS